MKTALIIGFGISGRSAAKLLLARGYQVIAADKNKDKLQELSGIELVDESFKGNVDLIVVSPGIPLSHPLLQNQTAEIIGEIELAVRNCKQELIGITGTNGKTTVTLLVEHVLKHALKRAIAVGNVGVPLAEEMISGDRDILVVELSSFQLDTMQTPCLQAGLILNITPDHLDRYNSMEHYAQSKCNMQNFLLPKKPLIIEETTYQAWKHLIKVDVCTYGYSPHSTYSTDLKNVYKQGVFKDHLPQVLQGRKSHDLENFLGAYALCDQYGISALAAYETFKKPHHRIEFVKTIDEIHFYDDSKGTNIDAVIRAVEAMPGPTYLIAGGVDKGAPYTPWIEPFHNKVRGIFAIGQAAPKIANDLASNIPVKVCATLDEAVQQAFCSAKSGDSVLLSPGCSSFDMFRDYAHRGEEFKKIVLEGVKKA